MARPRVFISSTFYDLKHVRASLDLFIEGLGYDSILSEKGDIAYTPDRALDASCYREVLTADIFVGIIGGRYGSRASGGEPSVEEKSRYDSVTRNELDVAIKNQIPTYILIERSVHAEYSTYLKNKDRDVNYAHVDSVEIFRTIEKVLALPQNNPVQQFDRFEEIARWLKEQWGGYFRELLQRRSTDQKITDLAEQVANLREVNVTLKRYLENLVTDEGQAGTASPSGAALVESEQKRLARAEVLRQAESNVFLRYVRNRGVPEDVALDLVDSSTSPAELEASASEVIGQPIGHVIGMSATQRDINKMRTLLGKSEFKFVPMSEE